MQNHKVGELWFLGVDLKLGRRSGTFDEGQREQDHAQCKKLPDARHTLHERDQRRLEDGIQMMINKEFFLEALLPNLNLERTKPNYY